MENQINYFATGFISLLTGIALYRTVNSQMKISRNKKLIKTLRHSEIKTPQDKFMEKQTVILSGQIAYDNRSKAISRIDQNNKQNDYVLFMEYKEPIYSNQSFTNRTEYTIKLNEILSKAKVEFNSSFDIISKAGRKVNIREYDQADYQRILEITRWENQKRKLTWTENFQSLILTVFRGIGTLVYADDRENVIKGIHIGHREVESGIKVGGSIMTLGTIGFTVDGQVFLQPQVFFRERLTFVSQLKELIEDQQVSRGVWAIITAVGLIYIGRRTYNYNKKHDIVSQFKKWWNNEGKTTKRG